MKIRILVIIPVIIVLLILAVLVYDFITLDRICQDSGGKRVGNTCLAPIIINSTENDSQNTVNLSQIKTMKPNSMEFFYYPNPEDTTNRDVFQKFILIRLPESLGGGIDDVSAFKAYSALSVSVHCQIKYWPDKGRQRMEDPCWGSMYRSIDGLMIMGQNPIVNNVPLALPYLDLSTDENGSLYVEPPKWTLDENGVIGEGRNISLEEIRQGSQIIIDSYEKTNPRHPNIPVSFAGQILTQINPDTNRVEVLYQDFSSYAWHGITFYISNVSAQDQQYFLNFAKSDSEFWQIDDTVIRIGGSALDKNNDQPEKFQTYDVEFILDGFKFTIEGQNLVLMKKAVVANYFPENNYDDLFLVSSTVEK